MHRADEQGAAGQHVPHMAAALCKHRSSCLATQLNLVAQLWTSSSAAGLINSSVDEQLILH